MKKKIILALGIMALVTGCGNATEKLTCTMEENETGIKSTTEMVFEFKDDKVQKYNFTMDMEFDEEMAAFSSLIVGSIESELDEINDIDGMEVELDSSNENGLKLSVKADIKKLGENAENIDLLENIETSKTMKETKEHFEELGAICK